MQNSNRNSVAIQLLNNLRNQYQAGGITPGEALKERLALSDVMYAPDLRNNAIQNHPFMQGIGQGLYQLNPQLGRLYGSVYSPLTGDPSGYHVPDAVFNPNNNSYLMDFETEGNKKEIQRQDKARQRGGGPTGFAAPIGQYGMGNIDLYNRPIIKNPDGSISTVRSMSFNDGKNEVLIPTVSPTGIMTPQEAINRYRQTGEYLGRFNTPEEANEYAQRLHEEQANIYRNTPTGFAAPIQYNQMTPVQQGMQYNTASFDNSKLN